MHPIKSCQNDVCRDILKSNMRLWHHWVIWLSACVKSFKLLVYTNEKEKVKFLCIHGADVFYTW